MRAQTLTIVSGNGQLVATQALSNSPMVVQAKDAFGLPAPNVAITWTVTPGAGTISGASTTDANGQAAANFLSTSLQLGVSFLPATVTASSAFGTVNFVITTVVSSSLQPNVSIELDSPTLDNPNLTAASGSTIPGGVVVRVFVTGGAYSGFPIPNVGVQVTGGVGASTPAPASCAGPTGTVLTDSTGTATCDLVVSGAPGTAQLRATVGSVQATRAFGLTITPGQSCNYSLSALIQSFGASGGMGTLNVTASSACRWNASSNANFVTITPPAGGIGNGSLSYAVASNSGAGRAGTLTIAGQTYIVNQNGGSPGSLSIPSQSLPPGALGTSYQATLMAAGGTPPYTWSPAGPISTSGLSLVASGDIDGAPSAPGTFSFIAIVTDNAGATQAQNFSLTINTSSPSSGFAITNASFPDGEVGQVYPPKLLNAPGGCVTPFAPQPGFTVSNGALPDGLSIQSNTDGSHSIAGTPSNPGKFNFTLQATDACGNSVTADFSITITGTPPAPTMLTSPASLVFTVQNGTVNPPLDQTLTVNSSGSSLSYSAAVAIPSGGDWLVAKSPATGTTPGSFTAGISDFWGLSPGDYAGSITIVSQAANSPLTVPVKLTVLPAYSIVVSPSAFTINQVVGSGPIAQQNISLASGSTSLSFLSIATTNRGGQWLAISASQGTTPTSLTAIVNSTGLAVGQYIGTITIIPSSGIVQTVIITLNILSSATLSSSTASLVFNYQQGGSLPPPQVVALDGTPVNVSASAATQVGSAWLSASPANGLTPLNLSVSVNPAVLQPGAYSGSITISPSDPSIAALTIAVTLIVTPGGPVITATTNGASYASGPVAPGEIVTIFGSGIGPPALVTLQLTDAGTVATNLGGTQVFFDGYPAPLIYSSATQVSAIVPYEISSSQTTSMMIQYQGTRSTAMTVPALAAVPGIFTIDASGHGQGAIVNQDGTINSSGNGANPGSVVSIYATGAGPTDPPSADGALSTAAVPTSLPVTVQIAGETTDVLYAGAAPGEPAGVIQVNARIPADVPRGTNVLVVLLVGATPSQPGVTVAIKP